MPSSPKTIAAPRSNTSPTSCTAHKIPSSFSKIHTTPSAQILRRPSRWLCLTYRGRRYYKSPYRRSQYSWGSARPGYLKRSLRLSALTDRRKSSASLLWPLSLARSEGVAITFLSPWSRSAPTTNYFRIQPDSPPAPYCSSVRGQRPLCSARIFVVGL